MAKNLILCDCLGSQEIDRMGLETATGLHCSPVFTSLCTTQTKQAAAALQAGMRSFVAVRNSVFSSRLRPN
jgi:hypothetical protein